MSGVEGIDVDMKFDIRVAPDGRPRGTHAKFAQLVAHILDSDVSGPWPLLAAVQAFAEDGGLGGLHSYLKIAGSRADKFEETMSSKTVKMGQVAVEYGTFIGTTAIRLADKLSRTLLEPGQQQQVCVITFEVEPVHVCVSRWLIELSGLSSVAEVWPGIGSDVCKRAADELGQMSFHTVFFDHRGTKFHSDLSQIENGQLLSTGALVIADCVLRPGAPQFLWHVHADDAYATTLWAFMDNTPFPSEDWMSISRKVGPAHKQTWAPAALERLSWDSDRWRRKSRDGGLRLSDWSAFAQHAADELACFGIEAQPWFDANALQSPPEGENGAAGSAGSDRDKKPLGWNHEGDDEGGSDRLGEDHPGASIVGEGWVANDGHWEDGQVDAA